MSVSIHSPRPSNGKPVASLRLRPKAVLLALGCVFPGILSAQVLWSARIQGDPVGAYSEDSAKLDFGPSLKYAKVIAGRAEIKSDAELGKKVLQVKYPKGCVGP